MLQFTYRAYDGGRQAAPSAEDGKDTDDELSASENNGDDVGCEDPLCELVVRVDAVLHLLGVNLLSCDIVEAPVLGRVEPKVGLAGRAVCDGLLALVVDIALAVVPQTDLVEVLEILLRGGALESLEQLVVEFGIRHIGKLLIGIRYEVFCIGLSSTLVRLKRGVGGQFIATHLEEVQRPLYLVLGVELCGEDEDQTQHGCYGEHHWREYTRESAEFAHDCGVVERGFEGGGLLMCRCLLECGAGRVVVLKRPYVGAVRRSRIVFDMANERNQGWTGEGKLRRRQEESAFCTTAR